MIDSIIYRVLFRDKDSMCMHCREFNDYDDAKKEYDFDSTTWDYCELLEEKRVLTSLEKVGEILP